MEFQKFTEKIKKAVQEYYGEEVTVVMNQVVKNNGVTLDGLTIMLKEKNVAPTIYLNSFYEQYKDGKTCSEIVGNIIKVYECSKIEENIDMDFFLKYEQVKPKIVYKLINYGKNKDLLKDVPHFKYLDLAIVFYCLIANDTFGNATILIRNSHCDIWKITAEKLYENAKQNTPRLLKYELKNMKEVMKELFSDNLKKEIRHTNRQNKNEEADFEMGEEWIADVVAQMVKSSKGDSEDIPMYVLSNQSRIHGAACILYQDIMKNFADCLGKDIYILPSSVHEVILVPAGKGESVKQFSDMVREVNETQVEEEEILSDCVYFYSRKNQEIYKVPQ